MKRGEGALSWAADRWPWRQAVVLVGLVCMSQVSHAQRVRLGDYEANLVAESARRVLPTAVRTQLPADVRDNIELNPLVQTSPPPKMGFTAEWQAAIGTRKWNVAVTCEPLPSGFFRCLETAPDSAVGQQHLYAHGGLVRLATAYFPKANPEVGQTKGVEQIRARVRTAGPLPKPGIDYLYFEPSGGTQNKGFNSLTRCTSMGPVARVPLALSKFGSIEQVACFQVGIHDNVSFSDKELQDLSATYFWIPDLSVALPVVLFQQPDAPNGQFGYFGMWHTLQYAPTVLKFELLPQ